MGSEELLTVKETAERLRLSSDSVYSLCRESDFPAARIGGVYRIDARELNRWFRRKAGLDDPSSVADENSTR